jgi:DNA (cytosine-5)-methyltransferase 1
MGLIIDNFAGGGGASTGIAWATGRDPDIAINHSATAIAMHRANHPNTRHYQEDIYAVDPREACGSNEVDLCWLSPDCTHHSKAKGGAPREKKKRGLAWVAIRWARAVRPKLIVLENVEEFESWGPLDANGRPDKGRAGETFRAFVGKLESYGYRVEFKQLVAADYGTPTTRRRLFLIARLGGTRAVWPTPTHGKGRAHPWRPASSIIDWSLPCPSIFDRKKPLKPATLARIAAGLKRYVIESGSPFIVGVSHGDFARGAGSRVRGVDQPHATVTGSNDYALVMPFLKSDYSASVGREVDAPLPTVTAGGGGHHSLVAPVLVQTGYGERQGQAPRVLDLHKPLGTVVACGQKHALVAAFLAKHYTMPSGKPLAGLGCDSPLHTVTTADHHSLVTATLVSPPVDRSAAVRAFLVKYYGSDGSPQSQQQELFEPLHTVTTKARFGLVTIHGQNYHIADIGMRMLQPRELFGAQGFPEDYVIDVVKDNGRPFTKAEQIELAGDSVCPQVAEAIVSANYYERREVAA